MSRFSLFGTSACHLCEQAQSLLESCQRAGLEFEFVCVDISASDQLFERYGLTIPVLRHPQGRELFWPFDLAQLQSFVDS